MGSYGGYIITIDHADEAPSLAPQDQVVGMTKSSRPSQALAYADASTAAAAFVSIAGGLSIYTRENEMLHRLIQ